MATFYIKLNKEIEPKDIKRKFNAFVELYGESEIFAKGDFTEFQQTKSSISLFNLNAKVSSIGNKYLDVVQNGAKYKIILPNRDPFWKERFGICSEIMFISLWI